MKIFKHYNQNQQNMLPIDISEMIVEGHLVRLVNDIVDRLDLGELLAEYKGGGATAYYPVMMLKVIIYAYLDKLYTCRTIAKALRENIHYMWLSGQQIPDFRTINNFRSGRLKGYIKEIFKQVVEIAGLLGLVKWETLYVDGSKIGANSNPHKMVWRKNVERYKKSVDEKIESLWYEIDRLNEEEENLYGDKDYPEVGEEVSREEKKEKIEEAVKQVNKKISKVENRKKTVEKKIKKLEERKEKYTDQEKLLKERNSYSKTDPDASAMKMKNNVISPGYNVMIGTENQVIIDYMIEQNASDGFCFKHIMEDITNLYGKLPKRVVGDSAFGNEENYDYCEKKDIEAYLKYGTFHKEKTKRFREDIFRKENLTYDKLHDKYICPAGKGLYLEDEKEYLTKSGYKKLIKTYRCYECEKCPYKNICCKGKDGRIVTQSEKLENYKEKAKKLLNSSEGIRLRKRRGFEVETPFGDFKQNRNLRRFLLRGLKKVEIETGLHVIAYNLKKIDKLISKETEAKSRLIPYLKEKLAA